MMLQRQRTVELEFWLNESYNVETIKLNNL